MTTEHVRIQPSSGWAPIDLRALWRYRELLYFLVWRDVRVRYKQSALGVGWAILQPLATALIFTLVFSRLAKIPSDGLPYMLFAYTGLLPWNLFAHCLGQAGNSLVDNANLITKVYFPRLVIPLSAVLAALLDFVIASSVLVVMMMIYQVAPGWALLTLPLFALLAALTALGIGVWLSAINVEYRDVRHTIPFLTQLWLFVTPVAYPSSLMSEPWRTLSGLNPMAGVVEGFRWAALSTREPPVVLLLLSLVTTTMLLVSGLFYFRRMERTFADVV